MEVILVVLGVAVVIGIIAVKEAKRQKDDFANIFELDLEPVVIKKKTVKKKAPAKKKAAPKKKAAKKKAPAKKATKKKK